MMKAIVQTKYGSTTELQYTDVEKPVPKDDEVLIRVYAASVNSWDWDMVRGKPWVFRLLLFGLFKPKYKIIGADVAGRIEAVGKDIKKFKPGDEVFGDLCECGFGAFAEYTCASENALTLKPANISFEEAASLPQAGALALQSVRDMGMVKAGQKILINGAGGGVGTFAVQLAKLVGADVTAVDSAEKHDLLLSLGTDHVIDYRKEDFTKKGKFYDLIIDVVANRSLNVYKRSLAREGIFIMIGGKVSCIMQGIFIGPLISSRHGRKLKMLAYKPNQDMVYLSRLVAESTIKPVIDKVFPLKEAARALQNLGDGLAKGKVIVTL